jgi:tetratricopeptide (TPR) repeat protein
MFSKLSLVLSFVLLVMVSLGCGASPAPTPTPPTATTAPSATLTLTLTSTLIPSTATPSRTATPLRIPSQSADVIALIQQANAEMEKQNYDQVIALSSRAIQLDPNAIDAYTLRGLSKINKTILHGCGSECSDAGADLAKEIKFPPNSALEHMNIGSIMYLRGELGAAVTEFILAIDLDPKYAEAFTERGIPAYRFLDKTHNSWDGFIAEYTAMIGRGDAVVWRWYRGAAYYGKGSYDLAIADFSKVIESDPIRADSYTASSYFLRGASYSQKGLKPEAIADLQMYLTLDPIYPGRAQVEQWIRQLKGQ